MMKEVTITTTKQLEMLGKEIAQDRTRVWIIAKNNKRSLADVAFMQLWHCLKMAKIHIERNLDEGAVTITPEFFQQPFFYEGAKGFQDGLFEEGLYHVVKYSAFFDDMVLIDEFPTTDGVIDSAMDILSQITYLA